VAISGKSDARGSGENKPKPLPWVATGCVRSSMVRRGSTVRVRQRASAKCLQIGICCRLFEQHAGTRGYIRGKRVARRHLATPSGTASESHLWPSLRGSPCKRASSVASLGENVTPSLEGGGHPPPRWDHPACPRGWRRALPPLSSEFSPSLARACN